MKKFFGIVCLLLITLIVAGGSWYLSHFRRKANKTSAISRDTEDARLLLRKLNSRALEAKRFVKSKVYNEELCFLIDMSKPSGSNRFFVYDLKRDSVMNAGLVTHGRCNKSWLNGRQYGNEVGCGCTSLGKYKVGVSYKGKFGLAYKLHGLDSTNNNAFRRYVVLHSHECVPEQEVDPAPICQSDGCPTVSLSFLTELAKHLDKSGKPVLLWVFE